MSETQKPTRLYRQSYLQLLHNAVGTGMFRNFYIEENGIKRDSLNDGSDSCAFFVSSVLVIFAKLGRVHATVTSTVEDLQQSDWQPVSDLQPGDVVTWVPQETDPGIESAHIGFYLGNDRAISTHWQRKQVTEHDVHFDGRRAIDQIYRFANWDS